MRADNKFRLIFMNICNFLKIPLYTIFCECKEIRRMVMPAGTLFVITSRFIVYFG
jgi:hypothetical protein